jgi:solute:Na+ symporter, SSS family
MRFGTVDIIILALYFAAMIAICLYVKKKASHNLNTYFLGGRSMPWWMLGISNASAMWDIAGTMWFIYILFTYGMKGVWLSWLLPIFSQIFQAIYLSRWLRRSNALTGAEWITTRFGKGRGGELSRLIIVIFAIFSVVCLISFDFHVIGKFCAAVLPWGYSPDVYAVAIMAITAFYVVLGGMPGAVLTGIAQFLLMAVASLAIGVIAMTSVNPEMLKTATPAGWGDLFFSNRLDSDWSKILPAMNELIASDGMSSMFGLFFTVMVIRGMLSSLAGPLPDFDTQRILAAKSPRESGLMSAMVSVALLPRWALIGGATALGLVFMGPQFKATGDSIDLEPVLPYVINNFVPAGLSGLILAGLLSAFMSTLSATINAGAAYLANDLYKRYINPRAGDERLLAAGYLGSVIILLVGIGLGLSLSSIDRIAQWILAGLVAGYTAANLLKWYWWRLSGYGYFTGMVAGTAAALVMPGLAPNLHPLYGFPFILFISTLACVAGSLGTEPEDAEVLQRFYRQVRPWGFWRPVLESVVKDDPSFEENRDFVRDAINCVAGTIWQLTLVTIPLYLVFGNMKGLWISIAAFVVLSLFLKKFWYDHLVRESVE